MNKKQMRLLRKGYRYCLRHDAQWKPSAYSSTRQLQERPDTASQFLKWFTPRVQEAIKARPLPGPAPVQIGRRSSWYANWRPSGGHGSGMPLYKRVALRRAQRRKISRQEAEALRDAAMLALWRYEYARMHELPY